MSWAVDFYAEADGKVPLEDFLNSLSPEARAKVLALLQILKAEGPNLPFPYSSQVAGKIRELRTQYGRNKIRILYFADAHRVFVLLHGFIKRSAKLEEPELRLAQIRMERHDGRSRKGNKS